MFGNHPREERSAERLAAALNGADEKRQHEKLPRRRHEKPENADSRIDGESNEHRRLRPDASRHCTEQERERHAHELHEHERGNARVAIDANLGAVDRRHPDDRLNAVVVEQKCNQHQKRLPVASKFAKRFLEPHQCRSYRTLGSRFVVLERPPGFGHLSEQWNGKREPPDSHADERKLDRPQRVRNAEACRHENPQQIDDEEESSTQIADGVGRGRHAIHFVRGGNVREQRVVEHEARCNADVGDDEYDRGILPFAAIDRGHHQRCADTDRHEHSEHALLQRSIVGDGAQNRAGHGHDRNGDRRGPGESRGCDRGRQVCCGDGGKEIRKDRGDDGRLEGGVRPVIHRPGAKLRTMETEAGEDCHAQSPSTSSGRSIRGAANRRRGIAALP